MAKKKQSKKALSAGQKWLAKARQSLSNCSRNYVVYLPDGLSIAYGPATVYQCTNWCNGQDADWKVRDCFIISQDFRDADRKESESEDNCRDCDPFKYGHPCVCRSKTIPKAWR